MAVVVLIMGTAALAAPGLMRTMSAERTQRASYGRAYMVVIDTAEPGRMELWRGITDSCRFNRWDDIIVSGGCQSEPRASDCVDSIDLAGYSLSGQTVRLTTPGPTMICFEPDDEIWVSDVGAAGLRRPDRAVTLTIQRVEGTLELEQRRLVIPISGAPRVM